nr:FAD-binding oxidoreductase [Gimesia aquarii]
MIQRYFSRNQLLNEGVEVFENRSADYTDILHEYFVPRQGLVPFVEDLRTIVPRHKQDLLNVTIGSIDTDEDTFLRYADQPLFAFVMLFHQPRSEEGDTQMQAMTVELIDAVLQAGGRYYLPYRLHATTEQFHIAYPQAKQFFTLKRTYDPQELFQNQFYLKYGRLPDSAE